MIPVAAPNYSNGEYLTTSMDYDISDKDQLRGRYVYNKVTNIDAAAAPPVFFTPLVSPTTCYALPNTTFLATVTNEIRVGFNRYDQGSVCRTSKFIRPG